MSIETSGRATRARAKPRVLIVDDEPHLARTLEILLRDQNDVRSVGSGAEARRILEADGEFDAILCDLVMTDVSGIELHAWLTERDPELARKVVFMTGGAFTAEARDFLARVSNPHIEKPFRVEDVQRLLDTVA